MHRKTRLLGTVAGVAFLSLLAVRAGGDVGDYKAKISKWVETRRILSEEKSEWRAERETLEATRDLLRQQKKAFEAEIAELDEGSTAADEERDALLLERGDHQSANETLAGEIRGMEDAVLALAPRLPEPLQKKLEPLLVQIPEDPERTRVPLGQRLMNVLGVLAQAEKWNGTATLVGETRDVTGDGQKVSVRTLYWGLGQAIYVDARGESAGIGRPGPDGWVFTDDPQLADDAARLLDIYEGNVDEIEFVALPVAAN
jgi:hypothetical protein